MKFSTAITRGDVERWRFRKDGSQTVDRLHRIMGLVGDCDLDRINPAEVRRELSKTRSPETVNRYMAALKTLLRLAFTWGVLGVVPHVPMVTERPKHRRALTSGELEAVLEATESVESKRLFAFLVDTGLRLGEALRLTSADIREGCVYLDDTKAGRPRVVPMTARALAMVEGVQGKLFVGGKWKFARHFKAAVMKAGLNPEGVVLHSLRHTCCTNLVTRGAGLAAAGAVLGHSTATMTSRYSHLDVATLKKTIALLEVTS